MSKICVVGLGYIGLPTALIMSAHGVGVIGIDKNIDIVGSLKRGEITFEEEGLADLFKIALDKGIKFSNALVSTKMYIIAVPTPFNKQNKKIDPSYVVGALREVLEVCLDGAVIIIESTISPGTIERFMRPVVAESGKSIYLVHAPERIIPGRMLYELVNNSRIIGADDPEVGEMVKNVYSSFCKGELVTTDIHSAEMSKIVENTFRDINIAYANELAKICHEGGMDVYEIIRLANMHPRVNILQPGPGVGGHCISVDPWFLVGDFPQLSLLIHEARKINDSMPEYTLKRIQEVRGKHNITYNRVGFYGITYKEDVDDIRESPTLQLFEIIERSLGEIPKCYDPWVKKKVFESQYEDFDKFIADVDLVVVMVGHSEIIEKQGLLQGKIVFDTKHILKEIMAYQL